MPEPLIDVLTRRLPTAKRQTFRRMISAGRIRVNRVRAGSIHQPIEPTDLVEVLDQRQDGHRKNKGTPGRKNLDDVRLQIIYEDADVLVVNKPAGMLTSTVPREPRLTLLAAVRAQVLAREPRAVIGLIHRLDRDASGLLVFSKSNAAYVSLKRQFFEHTVDRFYLAIVHGIPRPPSDTVESRLVERADGTVHSTKQIGKGEIAVTHYETVKTAGGQSTVRVKLRTGRKHQIRVHLRERGAPIVGDKVYGPKEKPAPRLMLAAVHLSLDHPITGKRVSWELSEKKSGIAGLPNSSSKAGSKRTSETQIGS